MFKNFFFYMFGILHIVMIETPVFAHFLFESIPFRKYIVRVYRIENFGVTTLVHATKYRKVKGRWVFKYRLNYVVICHIK